MALEKTKLTKEKIIDIVTNDYGLLGITQINYIDRGTSNIFQVIVNNKKYILKEFNSERTIEYIETKKWEILYKISRQNNYNARIY